MVGFKFTNPACGSAGCSFSRGAKPGLCTANAAATLSFCEIKKSMTGGGKVLLDKTAIKQVVWDNPWLSYNNEDPYETEINYITSKCLGGIMVEKLLLSAS